jgi:hypothetical protein
MDSSSAFSGKAEGTRGSSAMPQIGQSPGALRTISGCMGQVYSTALPGGGATGSVGCEWGL